MSMGIIQQDGTYKKVAGNFAPERVATDPTTSLTAGRLIYNTTQNVYKYYNGTEWVAITQSENEIEHVATNPASPDNGTVIYNTTDDMLRFYNGSSWVDCEAIEPQIASSLLKDTNETGFAPYNYIQLKNNNSAAKDDDGFVTMSMLYSILTNFGFSMGTNVPGFLSISEDNVITKTGVNNSSADGANGYSFPVADGDDPTVSGRIIANIQGTLSSNNYDPYDIPNIESIMKYAPKKIAVTPRPATLTNKVQTRFYTDYSTTDNVESTFNEFDQNMNLANFVKFLHDHSGEFILLYFDNSNLGFTGDDTVSSYAVVYNVAQTTSASDTSFIHRFMIPFGTAGSANQDGYGFGTLFIDVEYTMNTDGTVGNSIDIDYIFSINAVRPTSDTLPTTRNYGVHCGRRINRENKVFYSGYTNGDYGDEFELNIDMSDLSDFVNAVNTGLYTNDDYYNLCIRAIALN